jgi:hypothetical protein
MKRVRDRLKESWTLLVTNGPFWLRKIIWKIYLTPDRSQPEYPLPDSLQKNLREFRETGITRIDGRFADLASYLKEKYFSPIDLGLLKNDPRVRGQMIRDKYGVEVNCSVSFEDRNLHSLLFDRDLLRLIYNYYGRQPFYRNQPVVFRDRCLQGDELLGSGRYHIDVYRQVSMMLLISDLTLSDTHMQYAACSHHEPQRTTDRRLIDEADVERRFKIVDCIGPKGTLYIFDAGAGFHRGKYALNSCREFFHTNFTTGWLPWTGDRLDSDDSASGLRELDPEVRRTLRFALR